MIKGEQAAALPGGTTWTEAASQAKPEEERVGAGKIGVAGRSAGASSSEKELDAGTDPVAAVQALLPLPRLLPIAISGRTFLSTAKGVESLEIPFTAAAGTSKASDDSFRPDLLQGDGANGKKGVDGLTPIGGSTTRAGASLGLPAPQSAKSLPGDRLLVGGEQSTSAPVPLQLARIAEGRLADQETMEQLRDAETVAQAAAQEAWNSAFQAKLKADDAAQEKLYATERSLQYRASAAANEAVDLALKALDDRQERLALEERVASDNRRILGLERLLVLEQDSTGLGEVGTLGRRPRPAQRGQRDCATQRPFGTRQDSPKAGCCMSCAEHAGGAKCASAPDHPDGHLAEEAAACRQPPPSLVVPLWSVFICGVRGPELRPPRSYVSCDALRPPDLGESVIEPPQAPELPTDSQDVARPIRASGVVTPPLVETVDDGKAVCLPGHSVYARFTSIPLCPHAAHAQPSGEDYLSIVSPEYRGKPGEPPGFECHCECDCKDVLVEVPYDGLTQPWWEQQQSSDATATVPQMAEPTSLAEESEYLELYPPAMDATAASMSVHAAVFPLQFAGDRWRPSKTGSPVKHLPYASGR